MMPALALADITVTGKTSSTIKAYVRPLEFIEVTNELGGWQDNLEMQQLGGWNTPYEVALRLRVTSLPNKFQVRLDAPLVLQNAKKQVFRQPTVTMGPEGGAPSPCRWRRMPNSRTRRLLSRGRIPSACTRSRLPPCLPKAISGMSWARIRASCR